MAITPPKCRLCLQERPLLRSHIIPEFMYEAIYDHKHRFMTFKVDGGRPKIEQKGIREDLLCAECEQRFGDYETYVARIWRGQEQVSHRREGKLVTLEGVDYARLKLFQMSVLWRAGVSSDPFFAKVQLGPHQERLRSLLVSADPAEPERYGCLMFALALNDRPVFELIVQPTETHVDGCRLYRFVFGGMTWNHVVASHRSRMLSPLFAAPDGVVRIVVGELQEASFLVESLGKVARNNPNPPALR